MKTVTYNLNKLDFTANFSFEYSDKKYRPEIAELRSEKQALMYIEHDKL
jgi:hypothetical protein